MDAVREDIELLVKKELESANSKFPLFQSEHEGYAVIKEEVEEAGESFDCVKATLEELWDSVKRNCVMALGYEELHVIHDDAINAAVELIQVAAMCDKFIDSMEKPKESEEIKQKSKRVVIEQWIYTVCPGKCGHKFSKHHGDGYYSVPEENKTNYCPNCGQKLIWE